MANLTVVIDDATLKKARLRALEEGASVNQILRNFLEAYAGVDREQLAALDDLMALSRSARSRHRGAARWSRDELHQRD